MCERAEAAARRQQRRAAAAGGGCGSTLPLRRSVFERFLWLVCSPPRVRSQTREKMRAVFDIMAGVRTNTLALCLRIAVQNS